MPVSEPENPTRSGHRFLGWYIKGTGTEYNFTLPVTSDLNLEARWSQIIYTTYYTVTFDVNPPTGAGAEDIPEIPPSRVASGGTAIKPDKDPAIEGYQFDEWYSDSECNTPYDFNTPVTDDITLYAKWNPMVTFYANAGDDTVDGMPETNPIAAENGKVTKPATDPTRVGHKFLYWSADLNEKTEFKFDTADIKEPTKLYAIWEKQFTVTFSFYGLTDDKSVPVAQGETIPDSDYPDMSDFTGGGDVTWYLENGKSFSGPVTKDITLYPIWSNGYAIYKGTTYLVSNEGGLKAWREAAQNNLTLSCTLISDIILTVKEGESNWTAIGSEDSPYTGTFNGNGKKITNLTVDDNSSSNQGMFGYIGEGGSVKSLILENASISGYKYIGAITGYNKGTITNCCSTGSVSGYSRVGGVCGHNDGGMITACYSTGSVSVTGKESYSYVGGVCALNFNNGEIVACYSTGSVTGTGDYVGGVCGYNYDGGTITACYSTGPVSGTDDIGGVCGLNSSTITACYWSVPDESSSLNGIGSGNGGVTKVDGDSVTWTEGDNSALSAMNSAIDTWNSDSDNYQCGYKYTIEGASDNVPLVLEESQT